MRSNLPAVLAELEAQKRARLEASGITVSNAAKGLAPVDTGRLRSSITHQVDGDQVTVGTNVEYAPFLELGTIHQEPQPFLVPGLMASKAALMAIWGKGG